MKFRDLLNKIAFKFLSFRYEKGKQFYLSIFISILIAILILSLLTIRQVQDKKVKENILKTLLNSQNDSETIDNAKNISKRDLTEIQKDIAKIKVYICGKINNAGVYELSENTRIVDLISMAGGTKEDACLDYLNLAEILTDGQKIYIPAKEEVFDLGNESLISNKDRYGSLKTKIININFATKEELELLPGIGPQLAQRIIDYRNSNGAFKKKEDLKNITGIGDKKFDALKDLISI